MKPTSGLNLRLRWKQDDPARQGLMMFLGIFLIVILFGFAAFAVDLGYISLTQAQLQNAADAAALAAVLELKTSDPNLSKDQMKANALAEALKAASYNHAAGRRVMLDPANVKFGNRHYDTGGSFVTAFEGEAGYDANEPLNAVKVNVAYDQASGDRAELPLFFAKIQVRVLGGLNDKTAVVGGSSAAHLTPRDLVFVLDISNSMNDDTEGNSTQAVTYRTDMTRAWFDLPTTITNAQLMSDMNASTPLSTGSAWTANHLLSHPALTITAIGPVGGAGSAIQITATNHGLQVDDVIRIASVPTGSSAYGASVNFTWRVNAVVDANRFTLKDRTSGTLSVCPTGKTYTGTAGRVNPQGVFKSTPTSSLVRIRTTAPHGFQTGNTLALEQVSSVTGVNGVWTITRIANWNTNESNRFDLQGSTITQTNSDNYTMGQGMWRLPDLRTDTLTTAQRDEVYKRMWLRMIDPNGTSMTASTNRLFSPAYAQQIAALEFASGVTVTTITSGPAVAPTATTDNLHEAFDHPVYISYNTAKTASGDPVGGTATGASYSYPAGAPWRHWKWKAFLNARHASTSSQAQYTADKNVVATVAVNSNGNLTNRTISLDRYAQWALGDGLVPALKGQPHFGRDNNLNNVVDSFPPTLTDLPTPQRGSESYTDYPDYAGYYPRPAYQVYTPASVSGTTVTFGSPTVYDSSLINTVEGTPTQGVHANNVPDMPFTYVRQATLNGINAMISTENGGNEAFDQVAMVTFGTRAWVESDLTNELEVAIKNANNRLCVAASNLSVNPGGNGNTNIGGAIRKAIDVLMNRNGYSRGRTYTNKTIALLTDGTPNISPSSGFDAAEFSSGSDTLTNNDSLGQGYARHWADKAAADKIVVHTIGFGCDNAQKTHLQDLADRTGGLFFAVDNPATEYEQLNNIFIAIGKDKLGKLFSN